MADASAGALRALQTLWAFRAKVAEGIFHDVRHRYAGSMLGLGWSILFPVAQICIYAIVYVFIFKVRPTGMTRDEYIVMVFAGLIPLMAFNESLSTGTASLTSNRSLLTSTVFPPELIPVRALLAAQVPAMLGFSVLLLVTVLTGMATPAAFLMVPVLWVLLAMFCAGLCWILSLVSLVVRDVQQVLPLFMMALLILSPFAYTPEMVPSGLKLLVYLNPLSYFVFSFQALLAFGKMPDASHVAAVACIAFGTFWLGFVFFRKAKYVFFDYA